MSELHLSKRRALAARLFVFLLPLVASACLAADALAVPATPKLVLTNPSSTEGAPAGSTTPAILGEAEPEDGIILERAPFFEGATFGPITNAGTQQPTYEITIFNAPECGGAVVATGSAGALETSGIVVPAAPDAKNGYSAIQVNPAEPAEPSGCSNALYYWDGNVSAEPGAGGGGGGSDGGGAGSGNGGSGGSSSGGSSSGGSSTGGGSVGGASPAGPKPEAPNLHMVPGQRANDMTPLIAGGAPSGTSVSVYASGNCSGSPVAKGTPAQLSAGFQVSVSANTATTFSAVAIGAQHSNCSDPVTYTEDSSPPRTRITMGPGVKTRKHRAVFRFMDVTEDPPGTTFVCKVDKKKWKPCSSPFPLKHLKAGHCELKIRATDSAGNVERRAVKRRFIVVLPARR
jgi:hypothetical protein